jgi:flagellar basal-body rod protein FlgB
MSSMIAPLQNALDYHLERHNLLSSNLAHVDTPGYMPRELLRKTSFDEVLGGQMSVTDARHLGPQGTATNEWEVGIDDNAPVNPDGNGVNLDREAVKIAANNLRYDAISTMVQANFTMMQLAAKDGR